MKILVTGGAGFIGSHLSDRLILDSHEVFVIDNLSSGREGNIAKRARFLKEDIRNHSLGDIFKKEKFEIVFHLAAQSDVSKSLKNPKMDMETNILGTLNLLELSAKNKVKKFIFANSVACFGEPKYLPIDEKHPPSPISFYGLSKYTGSFYVQLFGRKKNLPFVNLIFANVYGPKQNPFGEGGVVAKFIYSMISGDPPNVFGSGNQTRDFIFVEDLVLALTLSLKIKNETLPIGTGMETSVNQLYQKIAQKLNFLKKPAYKPKKEGDIERSVVSSKKAKKLLGFSPRTSLDVGLEKTISYFKEIY